MAARAGLVVGAVAITAGIAWFALREREENTTPGKVDPGSATVSVTPPAGSDSGSSFIRTTRDGKAAIFAPAGPALEGSSADGSAETVAVTTPDSAFDSETRDAAWASRTEDEIRRRFRSLRGGSLDATECRQDQCLLTLSGTEEQMSQTLAELETKRGLVGFAHHVVLTGPEQKDGKLVIKAYAMFARDAVPQPAN
ncbi:MAG: hypothetical protein H0T46_21645 [Deltaproteobacteria bacterium]|nr:hypothetical protein [Deltaproteobacteria bacterium]